MNTINKCAALVLLALATPAAWAVATVVPASHVDIAFDSDTSYFGSMMSTNSYVYFESYVVPPWTTDGDALVLSPGMALDIGASGYADSGSIGFWLNGFSFAVHSGYQITGYQISFEGAASTVGAGSVGVMGSLGYGSVGPASYVYTSGIMDSMPSDFYGQLTLDAPYVEGPDGTAEVFGTAYASIDSIRIEAITQPVPEPETWALFGGGLAALTLMRRRRAG